METKQLKVKRGRPKKYFSEEEVYEAQKTRARDWARRNRQYRKRIYNENKEMIQQIKLMKENPEYILKFIEDNNLVSKD